MKIKHSMIILLTKEKTLLAKKIEAMVDNKAQYSLKLLDHMFENEA